MPTIYRKEATRISIAEAKQLIIERLPVETTGEVYAHFTPEGEIDLNAPISVVKAVGKPHVEFLDDELKSLCAKLGIKPTMRWRPSVEGYPDTKTMDGEYTISHDEFCAVAGRYSLQVEIGIAIESESTKETVEQRRERLLNMFEEEEKTAPRGALKRVFEREKMRNPNADRSNIGKDIAKARKTRSELKRSGNWTSQLIESGKRKR